MKIIIFILLVQVSIVLGTPQKLNGFSNIIKATNSGDYFSINKEKTQSFWEYPTDGKEFVSWQTPVVPAKENGQDITFSIVCGLGTGSRWCNRGTHTVFINGRILGKFNVCFNDKMQWANGMISFQGLCLDGNNDLFGIMSFTVPAKLINYGTSQEIKVKGGKNGNKAWFMLSAMTVPSEDEIAKLIQKNNIAERIEQIKTAIKRLGIQEIEYGTPNICKWFGNKKAAVSITTTAPVIKNITIFSAKGKESSEAAINAVDKAVEEHSYLVEIWPSSKASKEHNEYLKALDCEIWQADTTLVQDYINLRETLILTKSSEGDTITISLHNMPKGKAANIPITIYFPIPYGIAWAEVKANGKSITLGISDEGFIFDLAPADFPAVLTLEKKITNN